jgi:hypothetical protein
MRRPGSQPTKVRTTGPVDVVDDALRSASRRELLTRHEAVDLLERAQASAPEGALGVAIGGIVTEAAASYTDQEILARGRVVDPLLDIRLVLCG